MGVESAVEDPEQVFALGLDFVPLVRDDYFLVCLADADPAALPPYEYLTIPGPDGSRLPARLLRPPGFDGTGKLPVIVYQYGGPGSQVVAHKWDVRRRDLWHKRMAQRGYAVLNVDNRSSLFFGKAGEDLLQLVALEPFQTDFLASTYPDADTLFAKLAEEEAAAKRARSINSARRTSRSANQAPINTPDMTIRPYQVSVTWKLNNLKLKRTGSIIHYL